MGNINSIRSNSDWAYPYGGEKDLNLATECASSEIFVLLDGKALGIELSVSFFPSIMDETQSLG